MRTDQILAIIVSGLWIGGIGFALGYVSKITKVETERDFWKEEARKAFLENDLVFTALSRDMGSWRVKEWYRRNVTDKMQSGEDQSN